MPNVFPRGLRAPLKLAAFAVLLASGACSHDFLDREPLGRYTAQNFFETEPQITQAVTAIYRHIRDQYRDNLWKLGEYRSDNTTFTFTPANIRGALWDTDLFVAGTSVEGSGAIYNGAYTQIARANVILANLAAADFAGDEELRARREAETRFLRAFWYWQLIRNFGDAVLITEPLYDEAELIALRRRPVAEIMSEVIVPDCEAAIAGLPEDFGADWEVGRARRATARMLLAKAHFTVRDYAAARPLLDSIVAEGRYALLPDFRQVFAPENPFNAEILFAAQFDGEAGQGYGKLSDFLPTGSADEVSLEPTVSVGPSGGGVNRPTADLLRAFADTLDVRRDATIGFYVAQGSSDTVLYPRKLIFTPLPDGAIGSSVDIPIFRYADVLLMRAEATVETSGGGDIPDAAFNDLNAVRGRAGLPLAFPFNPDPALDLRTADEFRAFLREERRRELALENYRWYDLVRYGVAESVMQAHGEEERTRGGYVDNFPDAYRNIPLLYPIPPEQVQQYGYRQNPGY